MEPFSSLSSLQRDFLASFFELTDKFFLTGGAALVGAYGLPRRTKDLDLFTLEPDGFRIAHELAREAAAKAGAELEALQSFTTFRRYLLRRGNESIEVDLVHELAPQVSPKKNRQGSLIIDPPEEIFANKVCALVGRSEVRDLWDLYQLTQRGHNILDGIKDASTKDGGVSVESVLMVISSLNWAAMEKAAQRAEYQDWSKVVSYFSSLKEELAMRILPEGE